MSHEVTGFLTEYVSERVELEAVVVLKVVVFAIVESWLPFCVVSERVVV
jgi:hypothetical protein